MASAISPDLISSALFVRSYDHDPDANTAKLASPDGGTTPWYWDIRDYIALHVVVKPSIVAAGGVTLVRVLAYTDTALTANGTVVWTSGTVALDDLSTNGGDQVQQDITAEQVREVDTTKVGLRYLGVEITMATNTDEAVVTIVAIPVRPRLSLSATQQA